MNSGSSDSTTSTRSPWHVQSSTTARLVVSSTGRQLAPLRVQSSSSAIEAGLGIQAADAVLAGWAFAQLAISREP